MLSTFILLSCFGNFCLQAQDSSTEYIVHNTWSYATEEIEELPFIMGSSLIREFTIKNIALIVKTVSIDSSPNASTSKKSSICFGGLIGFNKQGLKIFSSDKKVLDWEKHRPKPTDTNIVTQKKNKYFPIQYGSIYYSYSSDNYRTVSFFSERTPDSLPDGYLNCNIYKRTDIHKPPHHLLPQKVLPDVLKNEIIKENGDQMEYHYEETDEGFTESITNKDYQGYMQKNVYNHKKQLVSTYELTSPFRSYIEEHFYAYNEKGLVISNVQLYHDRGLIIQDSSRYFYNEEGQLIESLRSTAYGSPPEEFKPYEVIHANYYYTPKGFLENKVITNLTKKVRHFCTYIYNPSWEAMLKMPE
jgi:hypothetical protein